MIKEKRKSLPNLCLLLAIWLLLTPTLQKTMTRNIKNLNSVNHVERSKKDDVQESMEKYHGKRLLTSVDSTIGSGANIIKSINNGD
jgi:hypothetical protein